MAPADGLFCGLGVLEDLNPDLWTQRRVDLSEGMSACPLAPLNPARVTAIFGEVGVQISRLWCIEHGLDNPLSIAAGRELSPGHHAPIIEGAERERPAGEKGRQGVGRKLGLRRMQTKVDGVARPIGAFSRLVCEVDQDKLIPGLCICKGDAAGKARLFVGDDANRMARGEVFVLETKQGRKAFAREGKDLKAQNTAPFLRRCPPSWPRSTRSLRSLFRRRGPPRRNLAMRVFNIMLAKDRGGVESMAVHYHEALAAQGYQVTSFGHPKGVLAEAAPRAEFRPLIARFDYDPLAAVRLKGWLTRRTPALVLTHGGRAGGVSLIAAGGRRTVQVMHNQFFKSYTRHMRAGICVSRSVMDAARTAYPDLPLYETTNFTHLEPRPVKSAPEGTPVIGALGRLHEQKGFDVLLRALARVKANGSAFTARIAGEGPERAALEALRTSLGLDQEVSFVGWVSPVTDFLEGLDLFAMPSHYEPFGLSLAEALAAGVPAVASAIEGPLEILAGGRFGRIFPNRDDAALASALQGAMSDWPGALAQARAAQAHALSTYGFDAGQVRLAASIAKILAL